MKSFVRTFMSIWLLNILALFIILIFYLDNALKWADERPEYFMTIGLVMVTGGVIYLLLIPFAIFRLIKRDRDRKSITKSLAIILIPIFGVWIFFEREGKLQ